MIRTLRRAALLGAAVALVGCSQSSENPAATTPRTARTTPVATPTAATTSPPTSKATSTAGTPAAVSAHPSTDAPSSTPLTRTSNQAPVPTPESAHSTHRASTSELPLDYPAGDAQQVITVTAAAASSTTATLQAWRRTGTGWTRHGPSVAAWLGTAGFSTPASEGSAASPQGSFRLARAFGSDPDPGTALPYTHTTPADWWISQSGPLYNTFQTCRSNCPFTQGSPNEHLYYAVPYYEYAVVIDYNSDPVVQGRGSAFFLHVTVGEPTQGCVSIDREQLVRILRWLRPAAHPRILMGTG